VTATLVAIQAGLGAAFAVGAFGPGRGSDPLASSAIVRRRTIAIRNVQLFQDLTRSVDELRALGEISQAVSSSLDLDEVLTTIVTRAVQLSGTAGGSIFEFDQATRLFHLRTCYGTEPELVTALAATRIHLDETFLGRAAASGEPQARRTSRRR